MTKIELLLLIDALENKIRYIEEGTEELRERVRELRVKFYQEHGLSNGKKEGPSIVRSN
ncbi:hypothetical protein [Vibrio comitans]|uniref:Transposase n=1 Tax=Vibrio comitans NBRC 102076 TaxID=1219078 RepID=A0A4Y3IUA3_9VIBR|nr:hypothetical protein [Vibrio comitans]GEA62310.1 hypothetical protein VCO01S_35030 [Vibrio comitans NBRC 102076]